jgi:hypothetical protein
MLAGDVGALHQIHYIGIPKRVVARLGVKTKFKVTVGASFFKLWPMATQLPIFSNVETFAQHRLALVRQNISLLFRAPCGPNGGGQDFL